MSCRRTLAAVLLSLVFASTSDAANGGPVALILEAGDARLIWAADQASLKAFSGELLYPGDRLVTADKPASILHCSGQAQGVVRALPPETTIVIQAQRIDEIRGRLEPGRPGGLCVLPAVARMEESAAKGGESVKTPATWFEELPARFGQASAPERDLLEQAWQSVRSAPGDLAARVTLASALERNNLPADAAYAYAEVAALAPELAWAKRLVRENQRASASPPEGTGATYALMIGIKEYASQAIRDLQFADRDATEFRNYLASRRGGVPLQNVTVLVDRQATKDAIREHIRRLLTMAGRNDTVVLFISAHGTVSGGKGYLVTHNSDPSNLTDSAFPMAALTDLMGTAHVGRVLLFVDACRAGQIGEITERNEINRRLDDVVGARSDGVIAMMASQQTELAFEHANFGEGHGAFTYFLLRALNHPTEADRNGDGILTLSEFVRYVRDYVADATNDEQHPKDEIRMQDWARHELADLSRDGIAIRGWKRLPQRLAVDRSGVTKGARDVAGPAGETSSRGAGEFDRLIALQDEGQQIVLQYLQGDEIPQKAVAFDRCATLFREALRLAPGSPLLESRAEFCDGRARIFAGEYDRAAANLERAIRLDPGSPSAFNALGIAYLERARYDEAVRAFRDAIRRAPYWAYPHHNLGLAYSQMGDYDAAIATYRKAMQLAPRFSYLPHNLGLIYQRINNRRQAEAAYLKAISLAGDRAPPYIALGLLEANRGRRRQAEEYYRKAMAVTQAFPSNDPQFAVIARHNLALLLAAREDRRGEAETIWLENIRDHDYLPSRFTYAEYLIPLGRRAEAVVQYRAIVHTAPESQAARLRLADLLEQEGRAEDARAEWGEALAREPESGFVLERMAAFEVRQGRAGEARAYYEKALQFSPDPQAQKRIRKVMAQLP